MEDLFKKNAEGEFVPVEAEIKDKDVNIITSSSKSEYDQLKDGLDGIVNAVNTNGAMKQLQEEMKEQNAKFEEFKKGGFSMPSKQEDVDDVAQKYFTKHNIDMAYQGKMLQDKVKHPGYQMSEEKRVYCAEWMALAIKAASGDYRAREIMEGKYKTAIGDSGNDDLPIPDPVQVEIMKYAYEESVGLQDCEVVSMKSEFKTYPRETAGVTFAWSNTTPASDPTLDEVKLTCEEVSAYSTARNMTLADSPSDLVGWLFGIMSNGLGQEIDDQLFNGTGSPNSGLFTAKTGYSVNMGTGSTSFADVSDVEFSKMIAALDGKRKRNAKFYMNGEILHYVRTLKGTTDMPIFVESVGSPVPGAIYGKPYKEVVVAPSTDAAATAFVYFGDLKKTYIGKHIDSLAFTTNTQGDTAFKTNRTLFKLYGRFAIENGLPNAGVRLITAA